MRIPMWLVFGLCLPIVLAVDWNVTTPLDEYVWRDDGVYEYHVNMTYDFTDVENLGCRMWIVNFTSLTWMDENFSSQPVWWHWLVVSLPATVEEFTFPDAAFVYIAGGRNNEGRVPEPDGWRGDEINATCRYATDVGVAAALLLLIPNQPIRFNDDSAQRNRTEDGIIAWTWRRYFNDSSNPNVILQLPMTKGAVKAVDTINNIVNDVYPELEAVTSRVFVGGGSKRGWIAWLLGCVDRRVAAMAPMVLSSLNLVENFFKHYQSLGGWSWVLSDYYEEEIFAFMDQPVSQDLADIIDPYEYRERLTMPKMVISATGDEFFLPDDSYVFFEDLPEPKHMMMCENNDHPLPLAHERIFFALRTYFYAILHEDHTVPHLEWDRSVFEDDDGTEYGRIELRTDRPAKELTGWRAATLHPERRDFRLVIAGDDGPEVQPVLWRRDNVEETGENTYVLEVPFIQGENSTRFRGFFINAVFDGPFEDWDFDFTTEVHIIREELPFERCEGWDCMEGDMV